MPCAPDDHYHEENILIHEFAHAIHEMGMNRDHNHVHLRGQLKEYDPGLAALITEVLGDTEWRYTRPTERCELVHLRDYDPAKLPTFVWPKELLDATAGRDGTKLHRLLRRRSRHTLLGVPARPA